jgi:N-acetylglucosamine-6-sulfatase
MASVLGVAGGAEAQQPPETPNILFVLSDDQMPSTLEHMPNYQRLATEGRVFENTVNVYPLCCPARATLQTGMYVHNHRISSNQAPRGGWQAFRDSGFAADSVPTWVKASPSGYNTAYFGKYMNGYRGGSVPAGWDRWLAYSGPGMGWTRFSDGKRTWDTTAQKAEATVARKALQYVEEAEASGEPYMAWAAFGAPHADYPHPKRLDEEYRSVRSPRTDAFNEADVSDKPRFVSSRPRLSAKGVKTVDEKYRDALRSLVNVDRFLGDALDTVGEDTYVFFYTDNGVHTGYHRLPYGKRTPYESDMVFPMAVKGPGVEAGTTKKLVGNHDLAPTFADLTGGRIPEGVDGRSIRPLFGGNPAEWRDALLSEYVREGNDPAGVPTWWAVRTESETYVEYKTDERELYDIVSDPDNSDNLLAPGSAGGARDLPVRLETLKGCGAEKTTSCQEAEGP